MSQLEYLKGKLEATVSPMDYMKMEKENPNSTVLIDVRMGPKEARGDKIAGSLEIALNDLENNLDKLPKDKTLIVYCWSVWCNIASRASIILLENGYKVKELQGGIGAWKELEFPIEKL